VTSARRRQITMLDHEGIELADTADAEVEATQRVQGIVNGESVNKASLPQSPRPVVGMPGWDATEP
jgi:hypothetical protein